MLLLTFLMTLVIHGQISVNVKVVDDSEKPINSAKVEVIYVNPIESVVDNLKTGPDGLVKSSGKPKLRVRVDVDKEGYYSYRSKKLSKLENHDLKVILAKIVHPIPLYAKKTKVYSQHAKTPIGYDFEVGDWVKPYGKGKIVDVLFKILYDKRSSTDFDYSFEVSFPNALDGLQEFKGSDTSALRSAHHAPQQGYLPTWKQTKQRSPNTGITGNQNNSRNYWLRVRSKTDGEGNLISAHYMKVYGDFPRIQYYFNPTVNDRNLEFDVKQNLFKNLDVQNQVRLP